MATIEKAGTSVRGGPDSLHLEAGWLAKLRASRFIAISLVIHLLIILFIGGAVVVRNVMEPQDFTAGSGDSFLSGSPEPPAPEEVSVAIPEMPTFDALPAPSTAPPITALLTQSSSAAFNIAALPPAPIALPKTTGDSSLPVRSSKTAAGLTRGPGGGSTTSFFGIKAQGRRFAYLLDYSGSMSGEFRTTMEAELEKSLSALDRGTQVLVICWSGGAWMHDQQFTDVADKWERFGKQYDEVALKKGAKLEAPKYVAISPDSVKKIMKGIAAQIQRPGTTAWIPPFKLMMAADPPPDTVFFMTDAQIPPEKVKATIDAIDAIMKNSPHTPKVNSLWITNNTFKPAPMQELAQRFEGELNSIPVPKGGKGP